MKKIETPLFNPVLPPNTTPPNREPPAPQTPPKSSRKKSAPRPTKARRGPDAKRSALRFAARIGRQTKASWQRIKRGLTNRLARLDPEQIKRILVACGIAATVALIIIALAKHTALIIVLLAVLGAAALLKLWNHLLTRGF
jgi:hypothetical protein